MLDQNSCWNPSCSRKNSDKARAVCWLWNASASNLDLYPLKSTKSRWLDWFPRAFPLYPSWVPQAMGLGSALGVSVQNSLHCVYVCWPIRVPATQPGFFTCTPNRKSGFEIARLGQSYWSLVSGRKSLNESEPGHCFGCVYENGSCCSRFRRVATDFGKLMLSKWLRFSKGILCWPICMHTYKLLTIWHNELCYVGSSIVGGHISRSSCWALLSHEGNLIPGTCAEVLSFSHQRSKSSSCKCATARGAKENHGSLVVPPWVDAELK